ncbi:divalent-cation tolerance protein CutA [Streptomyces sp. NPDC057696]|uniref:divalent-cation tolerance protein CutA n=1 Tax=unclassified Streptomyces TaxID=2593676 RepID=UPI0036C61B3A
MRHWAPGRAEYLQGATATENRDDAKRLAQSAVQAKLATGAQIIGPVDTAFWHNGEYGEGQEYRILLKTRSDKYTELERHLIEHHPWTNPEVVATEITAGSAACLAWINTYTS